MPRRPEQIVVRMSGVAPDGRSPCLLRLHLELSQVLGQQLKIASTQQPLPSQLQQEKTFKTTDGHVWKDEWRTRGSSPWPLTNSQFGKDFVTFFEIGRSPLFIVFSLKTFESLFTGKNSWQWETHESLFTYWSWTGFDFKRF